MFPFLFSENVSNIAMLLNVGFLFVVYALNVRLSSFVFLCISSMFLLFCFSFVLVEVLIFFYHYVAARPLPNNGVTLSCHDAE